MRLVIKLLADDLSILTGAQSGKSLFGKLVANAGTPSQPEIGFLDFEGVSVATASFLRESVVAFRDYARSTLPSLYPVIANASGVVEEEFDFFLRHRKDAFWTCWLDKHGTPSKPHLVGELDEPHRSAFELVTKLGFATAPTLAARSVDGEAIGTTAWNNRLSFLASRGLLIERRGGKTKTFSPVLEIG